MFLRLPRCARNDPAFTLGAPIWCASPCTFAGMTNPVIKMTGLTEAESATHFLWR